MTPRPFRALPLVPRGLEDAPAQPVALPPPGGKAQRRGLLGAVAALAVAPVVVEAGTPAHPDAALLAACAEHRALFDAARALDEARCSDAELDAALEAENEALERVADIPAATLAGLTAKAKAVQLFLLMMEPDPVCRDWPDELTQIVMVDLLRLGGPA